MIGLKSVARLFGRSSAPEASPGPAALPGFDRDYYLAQNPDVRAAGVDPFSHFMTHGWTENRNPSKGFSVLDYLEANPDVGRAGVNPLTHFVEHGMAEGRPLRPERAATGLMSIGPPATGGSWASDERVARFHRADPDHRGRLV